MIEENFEAIYDESDEDVSMTDSFRSAADGQTDPFRLEGLIRSLKSVRHACMSYMY